METRIQKVEIAKGHCEVNGRLHGLNWLPQWEVTVTFDTEVEAIEFMQELTGEQGPVF
jgi:hypothetical protein